jgi:hypothetical protein
MAMKRIYAKLYMPVHELCAGCQQDITQNWYVRDLGTGIIYHNDWCLEAHTGSSEKAIEFTKEVEHG